MIKSRSIYQSNSANGGRGVSRSAKMLLIAAASVIVLAYGTPERKAHAALKFTVNMTGDTASVSRTGGCDINPLVAGDQCTLRSAIQAANRNPGADSIGFRIPSTDPGCNSAGLCTIQVTSALPTITESVTITGPGATKLRIKAANASGSYFTLLSINTTGVVNISRVTLAKGAANDPGYANVSVTGWATLNLAESVVTDNYDPYEAYYGIVLGLATVNVTDSTISENGVGIDNSTGSVNLTRTTVTGNPTGVRAGHMGGSLTVVNCTFAFNGQLSNNSGDPAYVNNTGPIYSQGPLTISNSTFSSNLLPIQHSGNSPAVIKSSIAEGVAPTGDVAIRGTFTSGGYNVVSSYYGSFVPAATDRMGWGGLGPLQNNGGLTATFAVQPGSPAIDNGSSFGLTTDQRGNAFLRTVDDPSVPNAAGSDGTDSGAFEVQ